VIEEIEGWEGRERDAYFTTARMNEMLQRRVSCWERRST
jgi:hypothetical protein